MNRNTIMLLFQLLYFNNRVSTVWVTFNLRFTLIEVFSQFTRGLNSSKLILKIITYLKY